MGKTVSIVTNDLRHCYFCGRPCNEIHHCIHGWANRKWSDRFHLVVGLCHECHRELHDRNAEMDHQLKKVAQTAFREHYPNLNFVDIFGKNFGG